jgi:CrcB protein
MIKNILIVGFGSFFGGISRYLLSKYVQGSIISTFPYPTFVVNIVGCFIIGLIFGISQKGTLLSAELKLLLAVGFCGGFTTFSTFANENLALIKDGNFFFFTIYSTLSVFLGILSTYLGVLLTKII